MCSVLFALSHVLIFATTPSSLSQICISAPPSPSPSSSLAVSLVFDSSEDTQHALTSDLLLQTENNSHGLVQHQQLGLRLLALQVQLAHVAQLLEGLVDVPHAQALPGVVCHPPLTLALGLLLRTQILVLMDTWT